MKQIDNIVPYNSACSRSRQNNFKVTVFVYCVVKDAGMFFSSQAAWIAQSHREV